MIPDTFSVDSRQLFEPRIKMWICGLLAVVAMVMVIGADGQQSYCQICADHTMCEFPGFGTECKPLLAIGLNAAERSSVLHEHNMRRRRVAKGLENKGSAGAQPAAANMRRMVWDTELAAVAQRWANQCVFNHDKCRRVKRFSVGQNIMIEPVSERNSAPNWKGPVEAWYKEVALFDRRNIDSFKFTMATGHYTQVVWAESWALGCGYALYKKSPSDTWYQKYYVCNYGPAGNVGTRPMYVRGKACSRCPEGTKCDAYYGSLCS